MGEASTNLIAWANFCTAIGTFIGIAKLWVKLEADNARQDRQITRMLNELRINTECNKAALETHIAHGANGTCHDALRRLNDFLNAAAHSDE